MTVLLCDAAFSSVPILIALKARGYKVAVCGSRPSDPGHHLADISLPIDYSDTEQLLRAVQHEGFTRLVPGCTDVSYLSCAYVATQLGLGGYDRPESVQTIARKDRFRRFCELHKLPIPRATSEGSRLAELRFPILVKPSDSFSGKGITKVSQESEVPDAVDHARTYSGSGGVVFEEFVEGDLFSHSAFLRKSKVIAEHFVNEYCTVFPYQVNSSHVCSDIEENVALGVRSAIERLASLLGLTDGLMHTQFISNGDSFVLIEVTRRCPGDLYAVLIEKSTGYNYAGAYASYFCNDELVQQRVECVRRPFSRHTVSVGKDCIFVSTGMSVPNAKIEFVPLKKTGERLRAAPLDRAGIFFNEHSTALEMKKFTPTLRDYVTVEAISDV